MHLTSGLGFHYIDYDNRNFYPKVIFAQYFLTLDGTPWEAPWKCLEEDEKLRRDLEVGPQASNTIVVLASRSLLLL